jgi:hypothetical protein
LTLVEAPFCTWSYSFMSSSPPTDRLVDHLVVEVHDEGFSNSIPLPQMW